ncbi:FAD-dependent oxidoreductase [Aspergillus mulundensis]|uniref:FAD-binding PCMH-type domain-containing protein n=1 Tax=Aspergillus mulundensis TaxID=1810919 RepID=A0A3D8QVL5_9EURO|nr:hypothetical protein DSM5745_09477 [Aspergillus mulundensis]RDW65738.1 hypothetical protein DSM5745_09477 [Aspergillus mulundensis]
MSRSAMQPFAMVSLLLLSLFLAFKPTLSASTPSRQCRCRPNDRCWPSEQDWNAFNRSINGNLIHLRPVGAACHGTEYDAAECADAQANTMNSYWRAAEPGALQTTNWESTGEGATDCDINTPRNTPCRQGRIPLYAVLAETTEEIQTAVRFAKRRNLRVVIKNTGHGGLGVSAAPDSLQINTGRFKRIETVDDFVPDKGKESVGRVVTIGAGVQIHELTDAGVRDGFTSIMGICDTIGIAGGYIQGGGLGLLASAFGMASDNAVEYNVVTADGDLVVANAFQNKDLFWALRGGGGGTFGIAVNTTVRALPDLKGVVLRIDAIGSRETIFEIAKYIVRAFPAIKRGDESGKTSGYVLASTQANSSFIQSETVIPNVDALPPSQRAEITKLTNALNAAGFSQSYTANITAYPHLSAFFNAVQPVPPYGRIEGSVLFSEKFYHTTSGAARITDTVLNQTYGPGDTIEFFMTGGGQLADNRALDTALSPRWRDVGLYVSARRAVPASSAAKRFGADSPMTDIRAVERPGLGSYANVADWDEPEWPEAFWDRNYGRLQRVKRAWDRDGLFVVTLGVGSEEWDQEQMCRVR